MIQECSKGCKGNSSEVWLTHTLRQGYHKLDGVDENGTGLQGATLLEKVFREGFPEEVTCCAET